jgi:hypothetical protein
MYYPSHHLTDYIMQVVVSVRQYALTSNCKNVARGKAGRECVATTSSSRVQGWQNGQQNEHFK